MVVFDGIRHRQDLPDGDASVWGRMAFARIRLSGRKTMTKQSLLSTEEAHAKRTQLIEDGFCIVPGVLQGDPLARLQAFCDTFLDEHTVDRRFRYQGSDFHIMTEEAWAAAPDERRYHAPIVAETLYLPEAHAACELVGLEGMTSSGSMILLSKPPHGPPLYWHQDATYWNHPKAALPWPSRVFLSYYMVDTTRENGCLRVIPGTHRRRIDLHDELPRAHSPEIQQVDETHFAFNEQPGEIDVPCKAGDLVIADGRMLHAAWPNKTDKRRSLVLQWWDVFPFPSVPTWWEGDIPDEINADPDADYEGSRSPGKYLKAAQES